MKIKVKYFAALREKAGKSEEVIETPGKNALELFQQLNSIYDFPLSTKQLKVAQNETYVDFNASLHENDTIVFIPPVAGG